MITRWFRAAALRGAFVALALFSLGSALVAAPAGAQEQPPSPVRFDDLTAGYDGVVRRGNWFPLTVTISNAGPDITGELVWQDEDTVFRRQVDLPNGARKRITLMALDQRNFRNSGTLSLRVGSQRLFEQPVRLTFVEDDVFVVGVIGEDAALLNSLSTMRLPDWSRVVVVRLSSDEVPEQWPGLSMLNALFVGASGSERWSDATRRALESWVSMGGQLIVGGGVNADRIAAGLGELLPATLGGELTELDLAPLQRFAGLSGAVVPPRASVRVASPKPGAAALVEGPLLIAQRQGVGRVLFAAFDLATLRGWTQEPQFWQKVLEPQQIVDVGAAYRRSNDNLLQNTLQIPGLGLPSVWVLLGYLLLYVLLVGPANYFALRRLDRREWAWLTVPATVLLFAFATYTFGFGVRGGSVLLNQITIVQSYEGASHAPATTFLGLFSPQRRTYTLKLPGDALVSDVSAFDTGGSSAAAPLVGGEDMLLQDLLVDVGSLRTLMAQRDADVPFQVRSSLRNTGTTLEGDLRIEGAAVQQALLVQGESAVTIGDVAAGETRPVRLQLNGSNFPWGSGVGSEGSFNRQQVLNSLFSTTRFTTWPGSSRGAATDVPYLLAWVEQPGLELTATDGNSKANNLALYVVQLGAPK